MKYEIGRVISRCTRGAFPRGYAFERDSVRLSTSLAVDEPGRRSREEPRDFREDERGGQIPTSSLSASLRSTTLVAEKTEFSRRGKTAPTGAALRKPHAAGFPVP